MPDMPPPPVVRSCDLFCFASHLLRFLLYFLHPSDRFRAESCEQQPAAAIYRAITSPIKDEDACIAISDDLFDDVLGLSWGVLCV